MSSFYGTSRLGSRFSSVLASFAHLPGQPFLDALPEQRLEQWAEQEGVSFGNHGNSIYTPAITLWTFLLQVSSASKCCVAAVARLAVLMTILHRPIPSAHTGAYCKARVKLPVTFLRRVVCTLAAEVEDQAPDSWRWQQRRVLLVDGTSTQLPDTEANQAAYPQSSQQQPGLGFPMMRLVVLIAFATAVLVDAAEGPCQGKESGETALLRSLLDSLRAGDVLVADRHYCSYFQFALLQERGVDVAARLHQLRRCDFRDGERLGHGDIIQTWARPARPDWMDAETYACMPDSVRVRIVRVLVEQPGYRSRKILVATTLLNAYQYTAKEIGDLYHRRWHVELDIRSIKQTMKMEELSCKTPERACKELWVHLLAYNLVRRVMAAAAWESGKLPRQLSMAAALQTLEAFRGELQRVEVGSTAAAALVQIVLTAIASQEVGHRPGRVEPRRVKRRQQKYPLLRQPRQEARAALLAGGREGGEAS
jgi:Transposase DDE domain